MVAMLASLWGLAVAFGSVTTVLAQEAHCYAPNGDLANNETYVPCNKLGINQAGVFSSCCALDGPPDQRDTCSTSGLCINRQGQPQRGFCTDKTWKSKACVHVCMDEQSGGTPSNSSFMTACNDGTATYCCGRSNTTCCGTDNAISILTQESVCTANTTDPGAATDLVSASFKNATIGLAAATGVVSLIGLLSTLWFLRQNRSLKKRLAEKQSAPPPPVEQHTPAQTLVEPQYTGTTSSYGGGYKHPYSSSAPAPPASPDWQQGNRQRYSELDASVATARSEMGSPTPYDQPQAYYDHGRESPVPRNNGSPMPSPRMPH